MVSWWSSRGSISFSTAQYVCRWSPCRFWWSLRFYIGFGSRVTITTQCVEGMWWISDDRLPFVIYPGHSVLSLAKFERCILSPMKIKETSASPTLNVIYTSISTLTSWRIYSCMCLPPSVRSVHVGIEAFWWRIDVKIMLWGINKMIRICWLPLQPSHDFDDVSTPVIVRVLVIVIPSHIL